MLTRLNHTSQGFGRQHPIFNHCQNISDIPYFCFDYHVQRAEHTTGIHMSQVHLIR